MTPDQGLLGLDAQPCRECGAPIPYFGRGRRRRVCDSCRPGWWPEVVREPTNIRRSQSGATVAPLPRHRHTDPPTSAAAAAKVDAEAITRRVLDAYRLFHWLNPFEVVDVLDDPEHEDTIRSAVGRLRKAGVLVTTGTTRPSWKGNPSQVLKLAEGS